jgi:hypothetical protein
LTEKQVRNKYRSSASPEPQKRTKARAIVKGCMTTVVRDLEIGQPNNSEKCSETAESVARESEGSAVAARRVPVPARGRLDQPAMLQKDVELRRLRMIRHV